MPLCNKCGSNKTTNKKSGPHLGEYCASCGRWLRWVSIPWQDFVWPVGVKHRGKTLKKIAETDIRYLRWAAENMKGTLQSRAQGALKNS